MQYLILLATALVFPVLFWLHQGRVDKLTQALQPKETLPFHKKLLSWWIGAMVGVLVALLFGLWHFNKLPEDPVFGFFKTADYEAEIDDLRSSLQNVTDEDVAEIVRIFRHAERLIELKNYTDAEVVLQNLNQGSDSTGSFLKLDAFVVNNNLGVLSFYIRRNKKFIASDRMLKAAKMPHVPQSAANTIASNIDTLDAAVNRVD